MLQYFSKELRLNYIKWLEGNLRVELNLATTEMRDYKRERKGRVLLSSW